MSALLSPVDFAPRPRRASRPWLPVEGSVVVICSHPEDVLLGVGGFIASSRRPITLVEVLIEDSAQRGCGSRSLASAAFDAALKALRAPRLQVARLGFADLSSPAQRARLRETLIGLTLGASTVILPFTDDDRHGDHVLGIIGLEIARSLSIDAAQYPTGRSLGTAGRTMMHRPWGRLELSLSAQYRKQRAMQCLKSARGRVRCDTVGTRSVPLVAAHASEEFLL